MKSGRKDYRSERYANAKIVFHSAKATFLLLANIAYIFMFVSVTIFSILNTTEFNFQWIEIFGNGTDWNPIAQVIILSPQSILMVVVFIQYLCSDDYNWKEYILAGAFMLIVYFGPERRGIESVWTYILLILGARKFSFRKLLKLYVGILFTIMILTIVGSRQGWVENLVYTARDGRNSYGFIYPTDCAAHFLFAALCYWTLRGEKLHYIEAIAFFLLGMTAWFGCKARFSTVLLVLLAIIALGYRFFLKRLGKEAWNRLLSGLVSAGLVLMPLLCNLGIHILSMIYTPEREWMVWFNSLVSSRLSLVKRGIDVYGFRLWGSDIPMIGNGGDTAKQLRYYYIDSAYMQISLLYGMILLTAVLLLISLACLNARQNEEWVLLIVLVFIALHALFEHHTFEMAYSPLLLSAFARLKPETTGKRKMWDLIQRNRDDRDEEVL